MATSTSIYNSPLFDLYSQVDLMGNLVGISIVTEQQDVVFSSGYVGDNSNKDRATDFSESMNFREVMIKYWTNEDQTVLKAIAVFSKFKAPFQLTIHLQSNPPVDEVINEKYIEALRGPFPITHTYRLLLDNPSEYPMISHEEIIKRLGCSRTLPDKGFIDLRTEITYRNDYLI